MRFTVRTVPERYITSIRRKEGAVWILEGDQHVLMLQYIGFFFLCGAFGDPPRPSTCRCRGSADIGDLGMGRFESVWSGLVWFGVRGLDFWCGRVGECRRRRRYGEGDRNGVGWVV